MRPPRPASIALATLLFLWPAAAAPGAPTPASLDTRALNAALDRANAHAGALVLDADTGETLYERAPDDAFTPASVRKLFSMSAVLYTLGAGYWFSTDVTGPTPDANGHVPRLTLSGIGDPSLTPATLDDLARQLRARGVRTVGAVTVNDAAFTRGGWTPPDGTSVAPVTLERDDNEGFMPTTDDAALAAGRAFRRALQAAGVRVTGTVARGAARLGHGLATTRSAPLRTLVARTLRPSDNIYAEQLLARLGMNVNASAPSSAQRALDWERRFLTRAGVNLTGVRFVDASGLSDADRATPRAVTQLLQYTYATAPGGTPAGRPAYLRGTNPFIEALPRAGTGTATPEAQARGGTLATRLRGLDVRAKTGTLIGASALAGYVRTPSGRILTFAVMMDRSPGPARDLRDVQDAFVRALANTP
ncbi:D-alanyl-D-alanine carboxypeptidase/D-alanyl-D-alanine-endopeptidase [Deinococcus maricopensis]|uniref:D-alanyl-D-alaninecarboxypeptidase/D-alanyl-D-al anine-endopeptidase n=1 Tax=Deinococcus maricopensis (strain DSM 21211 / LMG 22137 / NRRL B-23946 / LB-34) TaxID=709986 RepID=E8U7F1_DEIML|nr:D-alanyl-D-alanine carboxypeptidase [Deinococcus maricopensis]ADV66990.1 D-alanyl-D-alaninecarboxypeptidase/D-alanyl-D-al anine-endopeptidase [Deinococcus maricopensis DSM 21211]